MIRFIRNMNGGIPEMPELCSFCNVRDGIAYAGESVREIRVKRVRPLDDYKLWPVPYL